MVERVRQYRAEGYRTFQLKVGGNPDIDVQRIRQVAASLDGSDLLIADANTGWLMKDAARVVRAVRDVDVFIEQPCATYEECLAIRRRTDHPFVLDECIDSLGALVRGHADSAMDAVNLKISRLGGLSTTRLAREQGEFNWSSQRLDDEVLRCRSGDGEGQTGRVGLRCGRLVGRR